METNKKSKNNSTQVKAQKNNVSSSVKVKHRRILRDNIHGITKPALQRLCHRAGIKRISDDIYTSLRDNIKVYMEDILRKVVVFTEREQRRTVKVKDLEAALNMMGIYLAAGLNNNTSKSKTFQSCNSVGKSGPTKKVTKLSDEEKEKESNQSVISIKKPHRFRPGTKAIRSIRYQQKNSECLAIPKVNFERLVREICQEYKEDLRFSEGVFELLQLVVEEYIVVLCKKAYSCAIHAERTTIKAKDIELVQEIRQ
jgi:histone H3